MIPLKIAVSVSSRAEWERAEGLGADLIELRLDLLQESDVLPPAKGRWAGGVPLIVTLRSSEEGGRFSGTQEAWYATIEPWCEAAAYIDIEERWASCAPAVRDRGPAIIASVHRSDMPHRHELDRIARDLRAYGDIPKMVVTPGSKADVLDLCGFTLETEKPVCTGVMGEGFRFARVMLPLFGSEIAYCHAGTPTAAGQFHITEFRDMLGRMQ